MKLKMILAMVCGSLMLGGCAGLKTGDTVVQAKDTGVQAKSVATGGQTFDYEIKPTIDDNFKLAKYRLWLPGNDKKLKGILTLVPGANGDGLYLAEDPKWRKFAVENNFALVSLYMLNRSEKKADGTDHPYYFEPKWGTGQALLNAFAHFGKVAGKPEMAQLPTLMWGHSAGGQFNYGFASWAPERVIAFTAIKGGYYLPEAQAATMQVPALFLTGELDIQRRIDGIHKVVEKYRAKGALWASAQEVHGGHGPGHTDDLIVPFFQKMVDARLPESVNSYRDIIELRAGKGWMADNDSFKLTHSSSQNLVNPGLSWLVDFEFAQQWQAFSSRKGNESGVLEHYTLAHKHAELDKRTTDNEKLLLPIMNVSRNATVLAVQLGNEHISQLMKNVVGKGGKLHKTNFISLVNGDTSLPDNSIDSVVLLDNYQQLVKTDIDRKLLLAKIYRLIKPSGTLTIIGDEGDEKSKPGEFNRVYWKLVSDEALATGLGWDIANTDLENKQDNLLAPPNMAEQPTSKYVFRFTKMPFSTKL
ncbi:MAG: hypothetical protein HRT35_13380 [Algicola sp.]|nr:hypothetical protein [Algicola sp.]